MKKIEIAFRRFAKWLPTVMPIGQAKISEAEFAEFAKTEKGKEIFMKALKNELKPFNGYAGKASLYLRMKFNKPKANAEYIRMLSFLEKQPGLSKKEWLLGLGYGKDRNWDMIKAMAENGLIAEYAKAGKRKYLISPEGQALLRSIGL